jgi:hypothetical protein
LWVLPDSSFLKRKNSQHLSTQDTKARKNP